ncbi:peptide-methionine (S)-S-oxide reductase MsrA [Lysobacter sp. F6437]|uniref:peptide-methionine (S)-S-oxide reductase MsrA n=1 Tax=Lysobacter sp. F6437 TaxID=3459296 RepID=UPI00403D87C1
MANTRQPNPRAPHRAPSRRRSLCRAALIGLLPLLTALAACARSDGAHERATQAAAADITSTPARDSRAIAIFAGGCFWCMEPPFDKLPGVVSTTSGYVGGHVANPTYEQVSAGGTGHAEAVRVEYDPSRIGYAKLLEVFWHNIDPVAVDRQFCDVGAQYRSAIFPVDDKQRRLAEASKRKWQDSGRFDRPIATEIVAATTFYPAEDYHQDYYEKNPVRYKFYRFSCGRDGRLEEVWDAAK